MVMAAGIDGDSRSNWSAFGEIADITGTSQNASDTADFDLGQIQGRPARTIINDELASCETGAPETQYQGRLYKSANLS